MTFWFVFTIKKCKVVMCDKSRHVCYQIFFLLYKIFQLLLKKKRKSVLYQLKVKEKNHGNNFKNYNIRMAICTY